MRERASSHVAAERSGGVPPLRLARVYWGPLLPPHLARFRSETRALGPALAHQHFVQLGTEAPASDFAAGQVSAPARASFVAGVRHLRAVLRADRPDVILSHGFVATLAAAAARVGAGRPVLVYEIHGAAAFEVWRRHPNRLRAALRATVTYLLETLAILLSDRLFLVSDAIRRYYPAARLKPCLSVPRLLDGPPDQAVVLPAALVQFTRDAHEAGRRVVVFSGGTDEWQMLGDSLRLMAALVATGRYSALVLSPGAHEIDARLAELNTERRHWLVTRLPQHSVLPALALCDVGLLLRQRVVLNTVASPTKLYEYLYAGLAIITTNGVPEAVRAISETGGGVVVTLPIMPTAVVPQLDAAIAAAVGMARAALDRRPRYLWSSAAESFRRFLAPAGRAAHG